MSEEAFMQNLLAYAARHQLQLSERLGFGIHGIIYAAKNKFHGGKIAVKAHREWEPYLRERAAYERLGEANIFQIRGFNVPRMIRADDTLRIIEISVVTRPFVLDFAGAYLGRPPHFPPDIWADWEAEKRDQFDTRWPEVQRVLAVLEDLDIYMVDVSPTNIAFHD